MTSSASFPFLWQEPTVAEAVRTAASEREREKDSREKKRGKRRERLKQSAKVDSAGNDVPAAGGARTFCLQLDKDAKSAVRRLVRATRLTYNMCVAAGRTAKEEKKLVPTKKELRARFVNKQAFEPGGEMADHRWLLEVPFDVRDDAVSDYLAGVQSNFAKSKAKLDRGEEKHEFQMRFRGRGDPRQTIHIRSKHLNAVLKARKKAKDSGKPAPKTSPYGWLLGAKCSEKLPSEYLYDATVTLYKTGHVFLSVPTPARVRAGPAPAPNRHSMLSVDPGVRTFGAGYSPDGKIVEFAPGDIGRIYRLGYHLDDLLSRAEKEPTRKTEKEPTKKREQEPSPKRERMRKVAARMREQESSSKYWKKPNPKYGKKTRKRGRMRKAAARMRERIRNLVDEVHHKVSLYIVRNYRVVLIPKFQTSQMVTRAKRKIRRKTVRGMMTWSHYRFRQTLMRKARETGWCEVIECDEPYTSKTCGECGHIHHKLGGSKQFVCPNPACGARMDRDSNGARNILIRWLTLKGAESESRAMDESVDEDVEAPRAAEKPQG